MIKTYQLDEIIINKFKGYDYNDKNTYNSRQYILSHVYMILLWSKVKELIGYVHHI
jgi:hypothetical protein